MSKIGKAVARISVTAAAAVAAVSVVAAGTASADTFMKLPDGQKIVPAADGWSVVLTSKNNSAKILPSLSTPQTRSTWVTSTGTVEVKAPADVKKLDGKLGVGTVSGCQFPGQIGAEFKANGPSANLSTNPGVGLGGGGVSLGIPLTPGGVTTQSGLGDSDQLGAIDTIKFKKPGTYNVAIKDYEVGFPHCSGYAQARVMTWVEIKGGNRVQGFLYGAPFSLG